MPFLLSKEGEKEVLKNITRDVLYLRLFSNNIDIDKNSTYSDFNEVEQGGYEPKLLFAQGWDDRDEKSLGYSVQTWIFNGGVGRVYGYYITKKKEDDNIVMWSQRFEDGPFEIRISGDTIKVLPIIELV